MPRQAHGAPPQRLPSRTRHTLSKRSGLCTALRTRRYFSADRDYCFSATRKDPVTLAHRRLARKGSTALIGRRNAIFGVFTLPGLAFATWAARIPSVRDDLSITNSDVAMLLFSLAAGSLVGLVAAPRLLARLGMSRGLFIGLSTMAAGLAFAGIGSGFLQSMPSTAVGIALFGVAYSATDVLMNVEGANVERELGKTVLPSMHAFFSMATIIGAGLGVLASAGGLSVTWHFGLIAVLTFVTAIILSRFIPAPESGERTTTEPRKDQKSTAARNRLLADRRLILLGIMMVGMAFAEGSANDWISLGAVEGHGFDASGGAFVYGVFVSAMTLGRFAGGPLADRFGRVRLLIALAALGITGVTLFVLATEPVAAMVGAALWGLGGSLGFPIGLSAAADHPSDGPRRVSFVAAFGYGAFLTGPPLLGLLGEHVGVLKSMYLVVALLVVSLATAGSARPPVQVRVGTKQETAPE
ncbi:MFS transporter [Paenarthrobacter sp. NPDC090520]|uniref:MFS transporter n=1 Tax=Paenarthrobacter sp. NPDC090520 TaxID=3364382 RepID=UPI0038099607